MEEWRERGRAGRENEKFHAVMIISCITCHLGGKGVSHL